MTRKFIAIASLLVLGISAFFGGAVLVYDPTGETIGMSAVLLAGTPFSSFLIPGLILFCVLGIGSLIVAALVRKNSGRYSGLVLFQGMVLMTWILVQVWMIGPVHILQLAMCILGLMLLNLGWRLYVRD